MSAGALMPTQQHARIRQGRAMPANVRFVQSQPNISIVLRQVLFTMKMLEEGYPWYVWTLGGPAQPLPSRPMVHKARCD